MFAVIEYSSKSGKIWRHTPQRPNYLCDPRSEIDPTSFGCYVSAMSGEHVPLTFLINPTFKDKIIRKIIGHWPPSFPLDYLQKFDAVLVVYEIGNGPEITAFAKRLRRLQPGIKILGVPTQPYGILKNSWHKDPSILRDLRLFMNSCHLFVTIVKATKDKWQSLTATPVHYLPQPYPVEYARQSLSPPAHKKKIIYVAGVTDRDNILKGHTLAKEIQRQRPDFNIHVTSIPKVNLDLSKLQGAKFEVKDFLPWREHLTYLSNVYLAINTDYTYTRGRVQMDCAAVGTPSIGSNSDAQLALFPNFAANPNDSLERLIPLVKTLLSDPQCYHGANLFAAAHLGFYNYQCSASRLQRLINSI